MYNLKPFIKWAGGKTQLLDELVNRIPDDKTVYVEPFVGGGALFLNQLDNEQFQEYFINDKNPYVACLFDTLTNEDTILLDKLKKLETEYLIHYPEGQKFTYERIKKEFNEETNNSFYLIDSEQLARFIMLNKTCFNGLYRVNKKGLFNVPWGKFKKTLSINYDGMKTFIKVCQEKRVFVTSKDYTETLNVINKNCFVYLDPPYRPINETSNFNTYTSGGFNDYNQQELKEYCDEINKKGAKFLLSNSDCSDGFFDELYKDYTIERVEARRNINSKGDKRGKITELLIKNY